MTSDISSAAPPRHKPGQLFKLSPYAISQTPDGSLGSWGAVLIKPMKFRTGGWREGEELPPGTVVPGHVAAAWPISNRLAMKDNKYVRFFLSADEAAELGAQVAATASVDPHRAAVQVGVDEAARKRALAATRAESLAKARQAKAEKALRETV